MSDPLIIDAGLNIDTSRLYSDGVVSFVPEPASAVVLGLASMLHDASPSKLMYGKQFVSPSQGL